MEPQYLSELPRGIATDGLDNIIVTGGFAGTSTFGNITLTSAGDYDIFIAKYDADGNFLWVVQAGGPDWDYGYGIATDGSGNSIVTGYFQGTATFGDTTLTSAGAYNIFIAKIDFNGNFLWVAQARGTSSGGGFGIAGGAGPRGLQQRHTGQHAHQPFRHQWRWHGD